MSNPKHSSSKTPSRNGRRSEMHWYQVPSDMIRDFVSAVAEAGCAVVLGRTLNGSALSVCILGGNDKERDYIGAMDDVQPVLCDLLARFDIEAPASLQF